MPRLLILWLSVIWSSVWCADQTYAFGYNTADARIFKGNDNQAYYYLAGSIYDMKNDQWEHYPGGLAVYKNNSLNLVIKDHLTNIRAVVSSDNSACSSTTYEAQYDYYPYGKVLRKYENPRSRFQSTDHETDLETGYNNRNARWYDDESFSFLQTDPLSDKFPSWSPFNYVERKPILFNDPTGKSIYMLYYTEDNDRGDNAFKSAAETRKKEIESSSSFNKDEDIVLLMGISDVSEIKGKTDLAIKNYSEKFGKTSEVGVWSHAGTDGPIGTTETSWQPLYDGSKQMSISGWGGINFNWDENSKIGFYGCNTAIQTVGSFAQNVSREENMKNVSVLGQSSSAYPSFNPRERITSLTRSMGLFMAGNTYMVGGNKGDGLQSHWFYPASPPPVNPMKMFMNGTYRKSLFQGN